MWLLTVCSQLALLILEHTFSLLLAVTSVTFDVGAVSFPLLFKALHTGGELVAYILVELVGFLFSIAVFVVNFSWSALLHIGSVLWDISFMLGHFLVALVTILCHWIVAAVYWVTAVAYSSVEFVVLQPWPAIIGEVTSIILNCAAFIWTWIIYTPLNYLLYTIWTLVSPPLKIVTWFENGAEVTFERFTASVFRMEEDFIFVGLAVCVLVLACILCCCINRKKRQRKRERGQVGHQNVPVVIQTVSMPLMRPCLNTHNQVHRRKISVRVGGTDAPDTHTLPPVATSDSDSNGRKQSENELQQRLQALSAELERRREEGECVVCKDAKREMLLKPCNHYCVCQACVQFLGGKCPVCRRRIQRAEKIFHV